MARPPRSQIPNGVYHVTSRGNRRQNIFLDDRDMCGFLARLDDVALRLDWHCHAYCLMPNHYHLVIETPDANLSAGMHRLNGGYAKWFNRRHELDGHLFQSRFHALLVDSDWHLLELSRYLSLNPVRAALCVWPRDWPWSSYRALLGQTSAPSFLVVDRVLGYFGHEPERARHAFRLFVEDPLLAMKSAT